MNIIELTNNWDYKINKEIKIIILFKTKDEWTIQWNNKIYTRFLDNNEIQ